jgi:hypothetical protein
MNIEKTNFKSKNTLDNQVEIIINKLKNDINHYNKLYKYLLTYLDLKHFKQIIKLLLEK